MKMDSERLSDNLVALRPLVNGTYLSKHIGKTVTIVGSVISANPKGTSFDMKTSDLQIVIVNTRKPLTEPISGVIEVHGIVQDRHTLICDYYMVFPREMAETYDAELANETITLMHTISNFWTEDS